MPRANVIVKWHGANFQLKHRVRYKPLRQPDPTMRSVSELVSSQEQPVQGCHTSSTLQTLIDSPHHYVIRIFSIQRSLLSFPPIPNLSWMSHPSDHRHTQPQSEFLLTEEAWSFQAGSSVYTSRLAPGPICQGTAPEQKNSRGLWYHLLTVKTTSGVKNSPELRRDFCFWASHLEEKDLSPWIPRIAVTKNN